MLIVQKFGGSSLAGPEGLRRAAEIISRARGEGGVLAVVSAGGDRTDRLIDRAAELSPFPARRELDSLLSTGEQESAALLALTLQSMGIPARSFTGPQAGIFAAGPHGSARIAFVFPERLRGALSQGLVPVVAGFQASNSRGDICTLGRGGSDSSAAALAAALEARRCDIYSDVEGIYTADPRIIPGAVLLSEIDLRDMLALSMAGCRAMQSQSVEIALKSGTELRLLSSLSPGPGTRLRLLENRPDIAGITMSREKSTVSAAGPAAPALLCRLSALLREGGFTPLKENAPELRADITLPPEQLTGALRLLHSRLFE